MAVAVNGGVFFEAEAASSGEEDAAESSSSNEDRFVGGGNGQDQQQQQPQQQQRQQQPQRRLLTKRERSAAAKRGAAKRLGRPPKKQPRARRRKARKVPAAPTRLEVYNGDTALMTASSFSVWQWGTAQNRRQTTSSKGRGFVGSSSTNLLPIGFKSSRRITSIAHPTGTTLYFSEVLGPGRYSVTPADAPHLAVHASTPSGAWMPIVRRLRNNQEATCSGPYMFGVLIPSIRKELERRFGTEGPIERFQQGGSSGGGIGAGPAEEYWSESSWSDDAIEESSEDEDEDEDEDDGSGSSPEEPDVAELPVVAARFAQLQNDTAMFAGADALRPDTSHETFLRVAQEMLSANSASQPSLAAEHIRDVIAAANQGVIRSVDAVELLRETVREFSFPPIPHFLRVFFSFSFFLLLRCLFFLLTFKND
jgi:F/Y rich C-terminus